MSDPIVSIVTSVDHDVPDTDAWFGALAGQTLGGDAEAIVVDPVGNRHYCDAFERLPPRPEGSVHIAFERVADGSRAMGLNAAIGRSRGELLIFLANDFMPQPDFAARHLAFHRANPGRQRVGIGDAFVPAGLGKRRFIAWLEGSDRFFGIPFVEGATEVPEYFFYVGNASLKRSFLAEAGGFDEDFASPGWEDAEAAIRLWGLGMRSGFVEGATAVHAHPLRPSERYRTMREAGKGLRVFQHKYPASPHLWYEVVAMSPGQWRRRAATELVAFLRSRDEARLFEYYSARLNANLSSGYRAALRAERNSRAGQIAGRPVSLR